MFDLSPLLGMPPDASAHGYAIDDMMSLVHWLMIALFVFWAPFFLYTLYRFRAKKQPRANYHGVTSKFSTYLEGGVLVAETILLVGFAFPIWGQIKHDFPAESEATLVHVIAEQFTWNVHYPGPDGVFGTRSIDLIDVQINPLGLDRNDPNGQDDVTTINELYLPVDKPVIIELSSKDVIHSFALPHFRVKQDVIPGLVIPVHFTPTMTNLEFRERFAKSFRIPDETIPSNWRIVEDYEINDSTSIEIDTRLSQGVIDRLVEAGITEVRAGPPDMEISCAQLCGLSHYRMRGFVTVQTQAEFDTWMQEEVAKRQPAPPPAEDPPAEEPAADE